MNVVLNQTVMSKNVLGALVSVRFSGITFKSVGSNQGVLSRISDLLSSSANVLKANE